MGYITDNDVEASVIVDECREWEASYGSVRSYLGCTYRFSFRKFAFITIYSRDDDSYGFKKKGGSV